jgi:hypothetical protein
MSGVPKDWLVVIAFFVGFLVVNAAETMWLNRRTGADYSRSFFVAFGSNIFAITVGYFFSSVILFGIFMLVWDESIKKVPSPDAFLWTLLAVAMLVPILVLGLMKRLLVKAAKLEHLERPWLYSFAAAFLFNLSVTIAPLLVAYFL